MRKPKQTPFDEAATVAGSQADLARACGVTPQAASKWRISIPAERVLQIEKLTGISRHKLRPDIYPEAG